MLECEAPEGLSEKHLSYEVLGSKTADSTYPDSGYLFFALMELVLAGAS